MLFDQDRLLNSLLWFLIAVWVYSLLVPVAHAQSAGALKAQEIYSSTGVITLDNDLQVSGAGTSNFAGAVTITGAITGPIEDKGGQVFNVKAYGIPSDGSSDASAGIASLITTAGAGSEILVPPGTYKLGSGISVGVAVKIVCRPGATFVYAPTTGAAFTLAYGGGVNGAGIYNCALEGPGSTTSTTGIIVGTSSQGTSSTQIRNVQIGLHSTPSVGFGTAIAVNVPDTAPSMIGPQIYNPQLYANGTGISVAGTENLVIYGGIVAENDTGLLTGDNTWEVNDFGTSFDSNNTYYIDVEGNHTLINLFGTHFEDNATNSWTNYIKVGSGGGADTINLHGGDMLLDATSGSMNDLVNMAGQYSTFNVFGTKFYSHGATATNIVNFSANGAGGMLQTYDATPSDFANAYQITAGTPAYSHVLYVPIDYTGAVESIQTENMNIFTHGANIISGGSLGLGNLTSSTKWSRGTAAPSGSCNSGDTWTNINGSAGSTAYICQGSAWTPLMASGANGISANTVTLAAGTATWTFATAYSSAPVCTASDQTAANAVRVEAPSTTAVKVDGTTTDAVSIICTPAAN